MELVVLRLVCNTDACGRVFMISKNGDLEVSGPFACGMNDADRRMIPVFGLCSSCVLSHITLSNLSAKRCL